MFLLSCKRYINMRSRNRYHLLKDVRYTNDYHIFIESKGQFSLFSQEYTFTCIVCQEKYPTREECREHCRDKHSSLVNQLSTSKTPGIGCQVVVSFSCYLTFSTILNNKAYNNLEGLVSYPTLCIWYSDSKLQVSNPCVLCVLR